jgi:hypothetical protein
MPRVRRGRLRVLPRRPIRPLAVKAAIGRGDVAGPRGDQRCRMSAAAAVIAGDPATLARLEIDQGDLPRRRLPARGGFQLRQLPSRHAQENAARESRRSLALRRHPPPAVMRRFPQAQTIGLAEHGVARTAEQVDDFPRRPVFGAAASEDCDALLGPENPGFNLGLMPPPVFPARTASDFSVACHPVYLIYQILSTRPLDESVAAVGSGVGSF